MRFVSPAAWVDEVAGLEGTEGEWRSTSMTWRLTSALRRQEALLPQAARSLVAGNDTIALLDFARAIAGRFRNYLLYRPDILRAWVSADGSGHARADAEAWQRALWLDLVEHSSGQSPAQVVSNVREGRFECPASVASTVLIVSDPAMPPTVREIVSAVAQQRSVRWCVVAPAGLSEAAAISPRLRAATNSLSVGGLKDIANEPDIEPLTLLGAVQGSLRGAKSSHALELDDTLTLHACHSALREVETLRERAVAALEADPTLRPHDITLYVTSFQSYLPAIDAVFGVDEPGVPRLPYEVAGRPFRERSPIAFSFLSLLQASEGRRTLEEITSLLRLEPVANAARFGEIEVASIPSLLAQAGVVWGVDGNDRHERFGLPPIESGTWRHGLDRLVLGIATGCVDSPVGDVMPVAGDTTGNTDLLGRLLEWTDNLFDLFEELVSTRPAAEWIRVLERATTSFIRASRAEDFESLRGLRATLEDVLEGIERVSSGADIAITTVRSLLEERLEDAAGELGHLRGGLRVCRLEPGTVIPAKVVLIAGVDDALHPGGGNPPAWDLLTVSPQETDPDHRSDMLDVFRQAVLSAESRAHVAWTGFSAVRHDRRAASVAVSELRDLAAAVLSEEDAKRLLREEPAHPFSAALFREDPERRTLRSSARGWEETARLIRTRGAEHRAFAAAPIPTPGETRRVIALNSLAECVKDPTLFFCKRVLGLDMSEYEEVADCEPQAITPSGEKGVHNDFRTISWRIEQAQREGDRRTRDEVSEWLRHQPEMPYGEEGRILADDVARTWWPRIEALRGITWLPPKTIDLKIGELTIVGRLDRLTPDARVMESLYTIKPHSAIGHWVRHLVMNVLATRGEDVPRETHFRDDEEWRLLFVDDCEAALQDLCAFYESARRQPQALFRNAGCAWIEKLGVRPAADVDESIRAAAYETANLKWQSRPTLPGQASFPGEGDRPWTNLCWANRGFDGDPEFVAAFTQCSERVLLPFLRARQVSA